ncbi:MAG: endolytic transglycosylase MltG [Anaerolineales bacterium]
MNKRTSKSIMIILIPVILIIGVIFLLIAHSIIRSSVVKQFGRPDANLSLTQRIVYPIELFFNRHSLLLPINQVDNEKNFEISQGESVSMVCLRLEQEGLIEDAELFRTYLVYSGLDRYLQAGQFQLDLQMSPIQIAAELLDATPNEATITILSGWRIEEIAENIAGSGLSITSEEFIMAAYAPSSYYLSFLQIEEIDSLEGFLFPGTYTFPRDASLDVVIPAVLSEFMRNIDVDFSEGVIRQGLTLYEAVILASIVEKEAIVEDEKPLIASVFFNRVEAGMRLETDPTVQYSLGYQDDTQTWWKSPLSQMDLEVLSPYNTYIVYGLPPTPICNPDLSSLRAVVYPAETPYFYFRAACDGSGRHNFAITFEEHLNNQCD